MFYAFKCQVVGKIIEMIKVILFDADGVLFFHTDKLFSERMILEYGVHPSQMEDFFKNIFPECLIGRLDLKDELLKRLSVWGWPGSVDELLAYWFNYEHNIDKPLIGYIRGLKKDGLIVSVATNNDHYRAESLFHKLNLDESVFDKLYAAGDLGAAKPSKAFFEQISLDLPKALPNEILFWDDNSENVAAAADFGWQAELYTDFNDFKLKMRSYI